MKGTTVNKVKQAAFAFVGGFVLAGVLAGQPNIAHAQAAIKGKTQGHCKLVNVEYGRELYNGTCVLKETLSGQTTIFDIRMGSAESFKFGTSDGGKTWMHGPEQARFRDRGHQAVFRWGTFRLEVEED
jgi:hypothetical protein